MKNAFFGVAGTLIVIVGGVFLVSHLGLYPIGADNPPGSLERSLAGRAMDVYASKHKPAGGNPVQLTPAALAAGAKDYEEHCAFCHGGARAKISPMRDKFNPPAPQLVNRIPHDDDAWLFWVTKHGVRMTGMPSWDGVMSDDEMWKVVAFIKHSDKLPPEAQGVWQKMATEPGKIEEHTPAQHEGAKAPWSNPGAGCTSQDRTTQPAAREGAHC
jgi:thiosulfate dehydrogenase